MLKKLRLKFILINMGIAAAMLVIIFSLVFHFTKSDLDNQSSATLQSLCRSVQQPGGLVRPGEDVQLPYFVLQISLHGDVVASGNTYLDLTDEGLVHELIQTVYTADASTGYIHRYDLLYGRVGDMGFQRIVFVDVSSQKAALASLVQVSILIGVASMVAFLGISILLAGWAIRPVEKAWQQQRQFVSDASHELKTPLTVIMSNAELLQGPDCTEENRQQFTTSILTMSHHMRALVEGLLELARADNGRVRSSFEKLELSTVVTDAVMQFEPVFYERGLLLESSIQPLIRCAGSRQHLYQVADILLDNAAKYSAPGIVSIQLQRQGRSRCLLTVSNPGEPIPQEDLKRIFERFYRADEARSRTGSFGLGLSIAQSIVQEHGGKIWAESNPTGNRFCVLLQCEPPEE